MQPSLLAISILFGPLSWPGGSERRGRTTRLWGFNISVSTLTISSTPNLNQPYWIAPSLSMLFAFLAAGGCGQGSIRRKAGRCMLVGGRERWERFGNPRSMFIYTFRILLISKKIASLSLYPTFFSTRSPPHLPSLLHVFHSEQAHILAYVSRPCTSAPPPSRIFHGASPRRCCRYELKLDGT